MSDDFEHLRPRNADAEKLSWPQRVVVLEGQMAVVYPAVVGAEHEDGTTRPGILRRLEKIEQSMKVIAGASGIAWTISTFGLAEPIKRFVVFVLGGHP